MTTTRIYVGGSAAFSATTTSGWDDTSALVRVAGNTTKPNTTLANIGPSFTASTTLLDVLMLQVVYPLTAGMTFTSGVDTVIAQFQAFQSSVGDDCASVMSVRVMTSGNAVQATLLSMEGITGANPTNEWAVTTPTNRRFPRASASATVGATYTAVSGDYLVVELGCRKVSSAVAIPRFRYGSPTGSTDLGSNETDTTSTLCPWIEFTYSTIVDASATVSLGSLTLTGLAATAIRKSEGATLSLGTETLTGLSLSASAQAAASVALGSVSLTGVAAIAGVDAGAALSLGTETLTGIAFDALSSITALLSNATEIVLEGADLTAVVLDESGDYSVLVNRGTLTSTGISLAVTAGSVASMAAALMNQAGVEAIARQSAGSTVALGTETLTGIAFSAKEQEVGVMTNGVLTLTGGDALVRAAVLAAMGRGTLTLTGTRLEGRLGFKFSQFSVI